jgi:prepilin-type processing-associated H-X9-DG protein
MPLPEGFSRKATVCFVDGSVTDHGGYAPSPSPRIQWLCGLNDRYIGLVRGS